MKKTLVNLLFLTTGLVAGAAVGILYAPDEGATTRDRLSFQLSRYRERLAEILNRMKEVDDTPHSDARVESDRIIRDTRNEAERLLGHVEALMDQIKNKQVG